MKRENRGAYRRYADPAVGIFYLRDQQWGRLFLRISGCSGRRAQNVLISHRQEAVDRVSEARVIGDKRRSKV